MEIDFAFDETNLDSMQLPDDYSIICFNTPDPRVGDIVEILSYRENSPLCNGFIWCIYGRVAYIKPFVNA